jgi:hypothetical protein
MADFLFYIFAFVVEQILAVFEFKSRTDNNPQDNGSAQ